MLRRTLSRASFSALQREKGMVNWVEDEGRGEKGRKRIIQGGG
jgi:hypothetical protein